MADNDHILELSDLEPQRRKLVLDGAVHELLSFKDFGPRDHAWFSSRSERIAELLIVEELTDAQDAELHDLFTTFVVKVTGQADVAASLSYMQKVQVFTFWSAGFTKAMGLSPSPSPLTGES
jgi:hypothetical protein